MNLANHLAKLSLNHGTMVDYLTGHQSVYTVYKGVSFEKLKDKLSKKKDIGVKIASTTIEARSLTVALFDGKHVATSDVHGAHWIDLEPDQPYQNFYRGGQGRDYATLYFFIQGMTEMEPTIPLHPIRVNVTATDRWNFNPISGDPENLPNTSGVVHETSSTLEEGLVETYKDRIEPEPEMAMKHMMNPATGATLVWPDEPGLSVTNNPPAEESKAQMFETSFAGLKGKDDPVPMKVEGDLLAIHPFSQSRLMDSPFKTGVSRTLNNAEQLAKAFTHEDQDGKHYAIYVGGFPLPKGDDLSVIVRNFLDDRWKRVELSMEPGSVVRWDHAPQWMLFTEGPTQSGKVSNEMRRTELIISAIDFIDHQLRDKDNQSVMTRIDPSTNQEVYVFECGMLTLPDDKGLELINKNYQELGWKNVIFSDDKHVFSRKEATTSTYVIMTRPADKTQETQVSRVNAIISYVDLLLTDPQQTAASIYSIDKNRHETRYGFQVYAMGLPEGEWLEKIASHYKTRGWKDVYFTDSLMQRHRKGEYNAMYFVLVKDTEKEDTEHEAAEKASRLQEAREEANKVLPAVLGQIESRLVANLVAHNVDHTLADQDIPHRAKCVVVTDLFPGPNVGVNQGMLKGMVIMHFLKAGYDYVEFFIPDSDYTEDDDLYLVLTHIDV